MLQFATAKRSGGQMLQDFIPTRKMRKRWTSDKVSGGSYFKCWVYYVYSESYSSHNPRKSHPAPDFHYL